MTINFPATPITGTTHAHNGKVWKWDGTSWTGGVLSSYTVVGDGLQNIVEDTTPELGGTLNMGNNIIQANGGGITNTSIGQNYGYFPSEFGHYGGTTTLGWTFQNTGVAVCRAVGPNSLSLIHN